jgi:CheY-like chemotaxis protein
MGSPALKTVLIAEDDLNVAHILAREFEQRDWFAVPCHRGDAVLDRLQYIPVDVIVTDSGLEGPGGQPLLDLLANRQIPVIVYSAMPQEDGLLLVARKKADAFVPKPAPVDRVIEQAEALLGIHPRAAGLETTDVLVISPEFDRWTSELAVEAWTVEGVRTVLAGLRRLERGRVRALVVDGAIEYPAPDRIARTARGIAADEQMRIVGIGVSGPSFDADVPSNASRGTLRSVVARLLCAPIA